MQQFYAMKKEDLVKVLEAFEIDPEQCATRREMLDELTKRDIRSPDYYRLLNLKESVPVDSVELFTTNPDVVVKMVGGFQSYSTPKYFFSRLHPYVSMPMTEAEDFIVSNPGFAIATAQEVRNYYGSS